MKYRKCPRCGLNYILQEEELCIVCKDEIAGKKSVFDDENYDELICPYCEKNPIGYDEVMCEQCRAKRNKNKR